METTVKEKQAIVIDREFKLSPAAVWRAWSEPESLKKWFSPEGYTAPDATIDFQVGGKYLASMQAPDGKVTWSTGTYEEIIPMKKIVYWDSFADADGNIVPASYYGMPGNWDDALKVTIELEQTQAGTHLQLTHEGLPAEAAEDCRKGWNSCLDKLERAVR